MARNNCACTGYCAANGSVERIVCVDGLCQRRLSLLPAAVAIERGPVDREVIRILRARLPQRFSKLNKPARINARIGRDNAGPNDEEIRGFGFCPIGGSLQRYKPHDSPSGRLPAGAERKQIVGLCAIFGRVIRCKFDCLCKMCLSFFPVAQFCPERSARQPPFANRKGRFSLPPRRPAGATR